MNKKPNKRTIVYLFKRFIEKLLIKIDKWWVPNYKYNKTLELYGDLKNVHNIDEGNEIIKNYILSNKPFLVSRFGAIEGTATYVQLYKSKHKLFIIRANRIRGIRFFKGLYSNAGMFSNNKKGREIFACKTIESLKNIDLLLTWPKDHFVEETALVKKYGLLSNPKLSFSVLDCCYIYNFIHPWSECLKNKIILVVSPFSETIEKQYKNREKLFDNNEALPHFVLITYKAYNTVKGEKIIFKTWIECVNKMFDDISKIDFDIAILGCGSYGMVLGSMIKEKLHKGAIHIGGGVQILFGIKGTRFDNIPKLYNEFWVRPSENEKPKLYKNIENGCYW